MINSTKAQWIRAILNSESCKTTQGESKNENKALGITIVSSFYVVQAIMTQSKYQKNVIDLEFQLTLTS